MSARRNILLLGLVPLLSLCGPPGVVHAGWVADGTPIGWDCTPQEEFPNALPDGAGGAYFFWRWGSERVRRHDSNGDLVPGWPLCGDVISPDPPGSLYQYEHVECGDGAGGIFILFRMIVGCSFECGGDPRALYLQRVTPGHGPAPGWPIDGLPISANGMNHLDPAIAPDGQGGVVLAWCEQGYPVTGDIHAQRVSADGQTLWAAGGVAVCTADGTQRRPSIVATGAGGALIFWEDARPTASVSDIFMRRVSADGAPDGNVDGAALCDAGNAQARPFAISDGAGGAYVLWSDARSGSSTAYAQRVSDALAPQWVANGLAVAGAFAGDSWRASPDPAGGFLLVWADSRDIGSSGLDIYAQRVGSSGQPAAGWPAGGQPLCVAVGDQTSPAITSDGLGGFFATWTDDRSGGKDLYGARWHGDGSLAAGWAANGTPICTASGAQVTASLVPSLPGSAIVLWEDGRQDPREIAFATRLVGDGPVPVLASLVLARASSSGVELAWQLGQGCPPSTTVEKASGGGWMPLAWPPTDGSCRVTYTDLAISPGSRIGYRLLWSDESGSHRSDEVWLDVPRVDPLAIRGVRVGADRASLEVECTFPHAGALRLMVVDVAGRALAARADAAPGPGVFALSLGLPRPLPPGIYRIVLDQDGTRATRSASVFR